jgi:hypothetical protein
MMNRFRLSVRISNFLDENKALPAQKAPRQVPTLSPAQSRFYWGIGGCGAFSLERLGKGCAHSQHT